MIRLNTIRAQKGATQSKKRLGRGSGSGLGKTSGKGEKGQLARTGGKVRTGFEGGQTPLYRRLPKRGFTSVSKRPTAILNVSDLERLGLPAVELEILVAGNFVKGRFDRLAVLGDGEIKSAVKVVAHKVTASAKEKIEKAGGSIEIVPIPGIAQHTLERKRARSKPKGKASNPAAK